MHTKKRVDTNPGIQGDNGGINAREQLALY